MIAFLVRTEPGQAAITKIQDLLVPEKQVKENIEGIEEKTDVSLNKSEMGYVIYIDENRYTMDKSENKDKIIPRDKAENLPEVFMEIEQVENEAVEEVAIEIEKKLRYNFKMTESNGRVKEPIEGIYLYANTGNQRNDTVVKYYIIDNTKGGSFIIKQQFFLEASEGHGVRFDNMLKEFKIIPLEE